MGKKINELTEITEVPSSSYVLVDNGSMNNKVTKENLLKEIQNEIDNLKLSVSNGKKLIASAITDKGIETSEIDSFETMANNISNINSVLPIELRYNFYNENPGDAYGTITLISSDISNIGRYNIYWADDNGQLEEFSPITSFDLNGENIKTYEFISTNIIPEDATKIIVVKENQIKAEYNIPISKLNTQQKLYSIGLLSDIHIDVTDDKTYSESDFQKALEHFVSKNISAICCAGDIVEDGTQGEVTRFLEIKSQYASEIPMYISRGNHDCRDICLSSWTTDISPNGVSFEINHNNDIFLFLGMNAEDFNNAFSSSDIEWLTEKLETYKNQRVFLFEHVYIGKTGDIHDLYNNGLHKNTDTTSLAFRNLVAKYRNVILFTGHSHLEFILQRLGDNANCAQRTDSLCHRVHIPSCAKPRANDEDTEDIAANTYKRNGSSEGYIMDVYDDFIILKGINFVEGKYLPLAQYKLSTTPIDLSENMQTNYYSSQETRTITSNGATLTFEGYTITINGTPTSTFVGETSCVTFELNENHVGSVYYIKFSLESGNFDTTNRPEVIDISLYGCDYSGVKNTTYMYQNELTSDIIYNEITFVPNSLHSQFILDIRPKGNMIFNNWTVSVEIKKK